jgi:hypothetical protein
MNIELNIILQNIVAKVLGITQREHRKSCLKIYKHKETRCHPHIFMNNFSHRWLNEWLNPIGAPKIWKPELRVKKWKGSDIEWSNPYGNQVTHFINYIEKHYCNRKKIRTSSNARHIICISPANKGKTQIGWIIIIGQKMQRWAKTNNVPPNGSPCHEPNYFTPTTSHHTKLMRTKMFYENILKLNSQCASY